MNKRVIYTAACVSLITIASIAIAILAEPKQAQAADLFTQLTQFITRTRQVTLNSNEKLRINCKANTLISQQKDTKTMEVICSNTPQTTPKPTQAATPTPTDPGHGGHMVSPAPSSTPTVTPAGTTLPTAAKPGSICPKEIHDKYTTTGPDGKTYPTWHPPKDPTTGCSFGHEHGSDPTKFPALQQVGMPAYGYTATQMGMNEPHVGFKTYVANDTERNLWWLATFHMGTSGAGRAYEHHHTYDLAVLRKSDNKLMMNIHLLAETGETRIKCMEGLGNQSSVNLVNGSEPVVDPQGKFIPSNECTNDGYEIWNVGAQIGQGTIFSVSTGFDSDNGITMLKKLGTNEYSKTETVYTVTVLCADKTDYYLPGEGPINRILYPYYYAGDCNRTGDKRGFLQPKIKLSNTTGNAEVWTDAMGALKPQGQGIKQYIATDVQLNQMNTQAPVFHNGIRADGDTHIYYPQSQCSANTFCNNHNHSGDAIITFPN